MSHNLPGRSSSGPSRRPRRLRGTAAMRDLVRENALRECDLILPLFVSEKVAEAQEVGSMPGVWQQTLEGVRREAGKAWETGVRSVLLFGIPREKDERASQAYAEEGIVQRAVRALKKDLPEMLVITDVCLCEYMSHGHCGIVRHEGGKAHILNDESLELLAATAVSHAQAGADIVAPSDMMDGRVRAIREALDGAGHKGTVHRRALARAPAVCQRAGRDRSLAWLRPALRLIGLQLALGAGCPREGVERDPVALGCLHRSLHAFGPLDPQAGSL